MSNEMNHDTLQRHMLMRADNNPRGRGSCYVNMKMKTLTPHGESGMMGTRSGKQENSTD